MYKLIRVGWAKAQLLLLAVSIQLGLSHLAVAESLTLNFKNTDIHSFIESVSKKTGTNFVVDPRVKAKITVISSDEMDAGQLWEVFLSVLQVHGYSAVPSGNVTKIVPDVNAKQGSVPMLIQGTGRDQLVTHVITVQNVPAAQLVPILRPLVPQQGHLAAYAATNALIITDRANNINRLLRIVKRIDKPDNEEIEVVRLEHASASEVVRILGTLQQATAQKGGGATPGAPKLAADERTNSILIAGDKAARLRLRGLIAHLDTPLESGGNTRVIYLRYANAKDLVAILKGVQETQAKAEQGGGKAAPQKKNEIDIQADEHTNSLIITAAPDALRNLQTVIRQLDIRRAQVLVEAIIADISQENSRELGVSWVVDGSSKDNPVGAINLGGGVGNLLAIASGQGAVGGGSTLGLGVFSHDAADPGTNFALLVRALAANADNNILSTPSLVTLDNQEAEIVVGQNVPFVTGQFTSSGSNNPQNPFQTIERQDVGITLKVKPQINEGNTIKLDIEQEVSNVARASSASDIVTNKRSIKTTVMVEDGQTLVLGGLIADELRDREEKVPFLGDIPILGYLFRHQSTEKVKQNLMVFLHPVIMRDLNTSNFYTGEKYNYLRARQLVADEKGIGLLPDATPILPELEVFLKGSTHQAPAANDKPKNGNN